MSTPDNQIDNTENILKQSKFCGLIGQRQRPSATDHQCFSQTLKPAGVHQTRAYQPGIHQAQQRASRTQAIAKAQP